MTDRLASGTVADSPPMSSLLRATLCGLGCLGAALLGIALSRQPDSVAAIWLPNALLLAVALRAPYAQLGPTLGAGALAVFVANLLSGHDPGQSAGFTIANLISVLIPLLWLRRDGCPPFVLAKQPGPAVQLLLAVSAGTMLSAIAGGMLVAVVHGADLRSALGRWLASDLMGMIAVLPLGLRVNRREWRIWRAQGRYGETVTLYALCTLGTIASLHLSPYPFVTIGLPLLLAALRLGMSGTALLCAYETALFALLVWGGPRPLPELTVLHSYGPAFNALSQLAPLTVAWLFECRAADIARLRASEERLRSAMRDSAIGMALIDLEGRFVAVNPALCALGGHEAQTLLGHHFADFIHGPDRYVAQELARQLAEGTIGSPRYELRGLRADGSLHWLRVVASCMRDGQQRPTGFIAQIEDIDAQRQAERARTEQAALIERAHDAIIGRDADGRVTHWNRGAERLYGWSAAEMTGQPLHERLDTHNAVSGAADEPERTALDYWEGTLLQRHRDGHALTIESRRVLLRGPDGRLSATLEINRDVSTLREAAHLHAQFVALVARELRAPLTTIGGTLDLIASGALGTVSGEAQDLIDIARRHDARLMRIVSNIQDAERIAAGDVPLAPQTIALAALLGQLRDEYAAAAAAAGIRIDIDAAGELSVNADPERLAQVLAPSGTIIAYATAPNSVASDEGGKNGLYTAHLLQALKTPGLPIEMLFKQVRQRVLEASGNRQEPWESTSLRGDFYFVAPVASRVECPEGSHLEGTRCVMNVRPECPAGMDFIPGQGCAPRMLTAPVATAAVPVAGATLPATKQRPMMVRIPAGTFWMGSPANEPGRDEDELRHRVELSRGFWLAETEVTQAQYEAVVGQNPSGFKGPGDAPVENVSWYDAVGYCNKLSEREGLERCYEIQGERVQWKKQQGCGGYRLPTEAEWEYAARGGREGELYAGSNDVAQVGWFGENSEGRTHPVKGKKPNGWGLYDMSGNVWEWVWDWLGPYPSKPVKDPIGLVNGPTARVVRGGSWFYDARNRRVADRVRDSPSYRDSSLGFRPARSLP